MKVCYTLICFFFSALQDGSTGPADTGRVYIGTEGGNISAECTFQINHFITTFCRNDCEAGDLLVRTRYGFGSGRAQRGRYSIEYKDRDDQRYPHFVYVSITNLTKSDSGRYRCGSFRNVPDQNNTFVIRVEDATSESTLSAATDVSLYVRVVMVILFIVTSAAVLIYFRVRTRRPKPEEPAVEPEYMNVTEMKRVHKEVRAEDRRSRSPPVEISAV
ncbi:uncharacterized protein LOC132990134 isoform X2 [Labrus mixtus]|uniref:uncharacterized protein LOC132990134 isoform X2 n=1 Tax=Labrus mixtus TaxID=508554 RepID=UPI0029C0C761|nr:uncharacterized protein LOC132990134 isoform X2 [Labrus mixtus]